MTKKTTLEEKIENILDRLAVRMYDEGQLDKPSLLGRSVATVNINNAKEQLLALIEAEANRRVVEELKRLKTGEKTVTQYAGDFEDIITYVFSAQEIDDRIQQLTGGKDAKDR